MNTSQYQLGKHMSAQQHSAALQIIEIQSVWIGKSKGLRNNWYQFPGTATLKGTSIRQDAKAVETVYQTFYGHTSQRQAVIVRSDGSATAQYPSEGLAVSVDPEQTGKPGSGAHACTSHLSSRHLISFDILHCVCVRTASSNPSGTPMSCIRQASVLVF